MYEDWWPLDVLHSLLCDLEFLLEICFLSPIIYRVGLGLLFTHRSLNREEVFNMICTSTNIGLGSSFSNWMRFYIISLWEGNVACRCGSCGMMLGGQRLNYPKLLSPSTWYPTFPSRATCPHSQLWFGWDWYSSPFHPLSQSSWLRNGHVSLSGWASRFVLGMLELFLIGLLWGCEL